MYTHTNVGSNASAHSFMFEYSRRKKATKALKRLRTRLKSWSKATPPSCLEVTAPEHAGSTIKRTSL